MTSSNFITDYTYYFSNDECDPDFHFWSCLSLLGHLMGNRVWVSHGRFRFHPNIYVLMIGTAGSGKSTAYKEVGKLYVELFPELLISDSIQSREDIIAQMVDSAVFWKDPADPKMQEYHPFYILIDELADFISVNPTKTLGFFVGVFDASTYSTGFKKDKESGLGKQRFKNPHVSVLACAQPEWFMDNVKIDMFKRGLGRRCIILHRKKTKVNPEPFHPPDSYDGWARVKNHLLKMGSNKFFGEFKKTPEAQAWYNAWHVDKKRFERFEDPMLRAQLLETQHVLLHKVALLYACCRYDCWQQMLIQKDDYVFALKQLHYLEPDIIGLMNAGGKNEMAPVAQMMLDATESAGGWMLASQLLMLFYRQSPQGTRDFKDALNFLVNSNQAFHVELSLVANVPAKFYIVTPGGRKKLEARGVKFETVTL